MAIKLGCRYIVASLRGITNRNRGQPLVDTKSEPDPPDLQVDGGYQPRRWAVTSPLFHLEDTSQASVIRPDMLFYMFETQFGKEAVLPLIDKDTVVTITWSYTPIADHVRFTTRCLVRKDMSFPIVLGQRDWVEPLGTLVKFAEEDERRKRNASTMTSKHARPHDDKDYSNNNNTLSRGNSYSDAEMSQLADSVATTKIGRWRPVQSYVVAGDEATDGHQVGCNPYPKRRKRAHRRQKRHQKQQDQGDRNHVREALDTTHHRQEQRSQTKSHIKPLKSQLRNGCGKVWGRRPGKRLTQTASSTKIGN